MEMYEKQRHMKKFEENYLSAKTLLNNAENDEDFDNQCGRFVKQWFSANLQSEGRALPDDEQSMAIGSLNKNIEVVARAGSGKTTTIIGRADFLINHCWVEPDEILMLAFNRKAKQEMYDRMMKLIGSNLDSSPHIKTFHSLAYAVANRNVESKKVLVFDNDEGVEFDTNDEKKALSQVIQQIIHAMIREDEGYAKRFRDLMTSYFRDVWKVIEEGGYNLPQEDQLTLRRSLETKTLKNEEVNNIKEKIVADILFEHNVPYRIKHGTIEVSIANRNPVKFKCINEEKNDEYYDWYLREKKTRLLGPREFNKGENQILKMICKSLKAENVAFIKLSEQEIWEKIQYRAIDEFTKAITTFVSRCRKKDLTLQDLNLMIRKHESIVPVEHQFLELARDVYSEYIRTLEEKSWEDFDGLIKRASELIRSGQVLFDSKGDFRKIKHILIDEYQDFSNLFNMFIEAIQSVCPDATMFCVGDDWQAINAFAGSDTSYFNNFCNRLDDAKRYYLTTNYRSVPEIVRVGNELMDSWSRGVRINPSRSDTGIVRIGYIDRFRASINENDIKADMETKAILRLIRWILKKDKKVVLLFRTRAKLDNGYLNFIQSFFSRDEAERITAYTTHKYKGKQEDAVIVMDAIERKYPLIHPTWFFMRIFDDEYRRLVLSDVGIDIAGDVTLRKIVGDEKRLFYVALSRAKDYLFILTKEKEESRFLTAGVKTRATELSWDDYDSAASDKKIITIEVKNNGNTPTTIYIKNELRAEGYNFNVRERIWYKSVRCMNTDVSWILKEQWVKNANRVFVEIKNHEGRIIAEYVIKDGHPYKIR